MSMREVRGVRILVVSDVHGHAGALAQAIEEQPTARTVIFLGDGLRDVLDPYMKNQ